MADPAPAADVSRASPINKFDEYRFIAESTQHLGERRQAATQTYLTINTAIFAVMAFLIKDAGFRGWGLLLISLPLFATGGLVCIIWHKVVKQYKALIKWRFDQLMELERSSELVGNHQLYIREWEDFFKPRQKREKFGFSRLELWLPRLFLGLYIVYGAGLLVTTLLGLSFTATGAAP